MAVIISDQRMLIMKGTELLSKTVERFPDTVRILLSGYTDVEDLVESINSGRVFKYITKPWNPQDLKAVVHQAADAYNLIKQRTKKFRQSNLQAIPRLLAWGLNVEQVAEALGLEIEQVRQAAQ